MVFRSISKPQQHKDTSSLMATAPVKSQPLHNFALSYLKWGKNQTTHQRCRKPNDSSSSRDHHHRTCSSASEAESDGENGGANSHRDQETVNQKQIALSGSKPLRVVNTESKAFDDDGHATVTSTTTSNLVIKLPKGSKSGDGDETDEPVMKPWNLRPRRRSIMKKEANGASGIGGGGGGSNTGTMEEAMNHHHHHQQQQQQPKSLRLRGLIESESNVEKEKKKIRFSISLTREEIEEDVFILTGSKPNRRPKKRNRTVQKQVDNVFPGLWLADITPDSYDVPEPPLKK